MNKAREYEYMVCVQCMTYNQSTFIKQTLDGFSMQETNFPFVCLIVDDASTDGEQKVVGQYLQDNFNIVAVNGSEAVETGDYRQVFYQHNTNVNCFFCAIFLKYNHFLKKSKNPYIAKWKHKSKYVAICEGDDYWIDPYKLQKQVDFLEANPDYGLCYTGVGVKNQKTGELKLKALYDYPSVVDFMELLKHNWIETLSVVYRNELNIRYLEEINPSIRKWEMGDYPAWLWFAKESKIKRIDDVTAVYRIVRGSASHGNDKKKQVDFLKSVMDIKTFYMDYYHVPDEKRFEIVKNYANDIFKSALLKRNYMMYEYGIGYKKEKGISISMFDRICGLLLTHDWGKKIISLYMRSRVDSL